MSEKHVRLEAQKAKEEAAKYRRMYETMMEASQEQATGEHELLVTMDYDLFDFNACNRPLHLNRELEKSMRMHGFDPGQPISVERMESGRLKIRYGHNRFVTAKKLGIPVHCVVNKTDIPVEYVELELRGKERFSLSDVVEMWANRGKESYMLIRDTANKHNVPVSLVAFLFGGGSTSARKLKHGEFIITHASLAYRVIAAANSLFDAGIEFAKTGVFIKALSYVLRIPDVEEGKLIAKAKANPKMMMRRSDIDGYCEELESLYNYHMSADYRIPIAHLAKCDRSRKLEQCRANPGMRKPNWE